MVFDLRPTLTSDLKHVKCELKLTLNDGVTIERAAHRMTSRAVESRPQGKPVTDPKPSDAQVEVRRGEGEPHTTALLDATSANSRALRQTMHAELDAWTLAGILPPTKPAGRSLLALLLFRMIDSKPEVGG